MLFRPNFCANCGEKIERVHWGVLTSRRFCPVCESQFKGHDLIPRFIVGAGLLVGVLGVGSYLKSGGAMTDSRAVRQSAKLVEQPQASNAGPPARIDPPANAPGAPPQQVAAAVPPIQPAAKSDPEEPVYLCGAETKKGTPCSRRVKGNVRCFQHAGMPAMVSADKLRIK